MLFALAFEPQCVWKISWDIVKLDTFFHTRDSLKFIIHILLASENKFLSIQRTSLLQIYGYFQSQLVWNERKLRLKKFRPWGWFSVHNQTENPIHQAASRTYGKERKWSGYTISVRNWRQACWSWGSVKRMTHKHGGRLEGQGPVTGQGLYTRLGRSSKRKL